MASNKYCEYFDVDEAYFQYEKDGFGTGWRRDTPVSA